MPAVFTIPGPCTVSLGGKNLGGTKAGVNIQSQTQMIPITDDEHGTEPADWIRSGKGAIVTAMFLDASLIKAAAPFIGGLLTNLSASVSKVGTLAFDGDSTAPQLGQELIITERVSSNLWKAKYCIVSDPEQLMLASTVELQMPLTFVVAVDENDDLFYTLPSYLT